MNQQADYLFTVISNPTSPEATAILDAMAASLVRKAKQQEAKIDMHAKRCIGKAFEVKSEHGRYYGVISKCERAGVRGKYAAYKVWIKCGQHEHGPFVVTALPR